MRTRIALTGASSFTGIWIAQAFARDRWELHAHTLGEGGATGGLPAIRMRVLAQHAEHVHLGLRAEAGELAHWIRQNRPEIWIHHHHWMESFRSPQYDTARADAVGLDPLVGILDALRESGCRGIIHTGSYFEPGEGGQPETATATPYAVSKRKVWLEMKRLAAERGIPLAKCVIPNPVGPLENEDRLLPMMISKARAGEPLMLSSPKSQGDQLPVFELARCYLKLAEGLIGGAGPQVARPSGWVSEIEAWVEHVNAELIVKRLGLPGLRIEKGSAPSTAQHRNSEPVSVDWPAFWGRYAAEYRKWVAP